MTRGQRGNKVSVLVRHSRPFPLFQWLIFLLQGQTKKGPDSHLKDKVPEDDTATSNKATANVVASRRNRERQKIGVSEHKAKVARNTLWRVASYRRKKPRECRKTFRSLKTSTPRKSIIQRPFRSQQLSRYEWRFVIRYPLQCGVCSKTVSTLQLMIAQLIGGDAKADDPNQRNKIQKVMDITGMAEDAVATALFDAAWDEQKAIELLLVCDSFRVIFSRSVKTCCKSCQID